MGTNESVFMGSSKRRTNTCCYLVIHIFVIERCLALDFLKFSLRFESFLLLRSVLGNFSLLSFYAHVLLYFSQDGYIAFVVYLKKTETRKGRESDY